MRGHSPVYIDRGGLSDFYTFTTQQPFPPSYSTPESIPTLPNSFLLDSSFHYLLLLLKGTNYTWWNEVSDDVLLLTDIFAFVGNPKVRFPPLDVSRNPNSEHLWKSVRNKKKSQLIPRLKKYSEMKHFQNLPNVNVPHLLEIPKDVSRNLCLSVIKIGNTAKINQFGTHCTWVNNRCTYYYRNGVFFVYYRKFSCFPNFVKNLKKLVIFYHFVSGCNISGKISNALGLCL